MATFGFGSDGSDLHMEEISHKHYRYQYKTERGSLTFVCLIYIHETITVSWKLIMDITLKYSNKINSKEKEYVLYAYKVRIVYRAKIHNSSLCNESSIAEQIVLQIY